MDRVLLVMLVILTGAHLGLWWWHVRPPRPRLLEPPGPDVRQAMEGAFRACGLPVDQAHNGAFDVQRTGKLNDVLAHASAGLQVRHPLITVADILTFLQGQPRG